MLCELAYYVCLSVIPVVAVKQSLQSTAVSGHNRKFLGKGREICLKTYGAVQLSAVPDIPLLVGWGVWVLEVVGVGVACQTLVGGWERGN